MRHKLNEAGKFTLNEMGVARMPVNDAEEFVKLSKEHVSGKKTEYEALIYLSGICPTPDYSALRQQEQENMGTFFLSSLFGSLQYSNDGRVIAKTPAAGLGNDEAKEAALKDKVVRSFIHTLELYSSLSIRPALSQILLEHTISKRFIFELCDYCPIVPKENINLISQAIWLGFELDFSNAIHLIAPQVEKIIRVQLKDNGAHTTHLDKDGIEHENSLSTLLDIPEAERILGANLVFELKAVFTDSIGPNLRNEVAHGLLTDSAAYAEAPIYAWWILLRMMIHSIINLTEQI